MVVFTLAVSRGLYLLPVRPLVRGVPGRVRDGPRASPGIGRLPRRRDVRLHARLGARPLGQEAHREEAAGRGALRRRRMRLPARRERHRPPGGPQVPRCRREVPLRGGRRAPGGRAPRAHRREQRGRPRVRRTRGDQGAAGGGVRVARRRAPEGVGLRRRAHPARQVLAPRGRVGRDGVGEDRARRCRRGGDPGAGPQPRPAGRRVGVGARALRPGGLARRRRPRPLHERDDAARGAPTASAATTPRSRRSWLSPPRRRAASSPGCSAAPSSRSA